MCCILRNMDVAQTIFLWFPLVFMAVLVLALHKWPPKSTNMSYGYRTKRSQSSVKAWDYAQKRCFELMTTWTTWMVAWTAWAWIFEDAERGILITNGLMTLGVCLPLYFVEMELKKGEPYTPKGGVNMLAAMCSALLVFVL